MKRSKDMQEALDGLTKSLFGKSNTEAMAQQICIACKAPVTPESFRDQISAKEYGISGLCQGCQDIAFAPPEDEE